MTVLAQYLTLKYGAKSRGHLPTHRRPITGIARAELELVSFAGTAVRGPVAEGHWAQSLSLRFRILDRPPPHHKAPRLGPRALSISVTNSLRGNFVW